VSAQGVEAGPGSRGPWVYFIQAGEGGPIKIGFTALNPRQRLSTLQIGNAESLNLLGAAAGTYQDEQQIHEQFAAARIRGEWFAPTDALRGFIMGLCWRPRKFDLVAADHLECGMWPADLIEVAEFIDARRLKQKADDLLDLPPHESEVPKAAHLAILLDALAHDGGHGVEVFGRHELHGAAARLRSVFYSLTSEGGGS
jgi:hypothetical protein